MISKKEQKDTILTVFSKGAIVLINFAIVVCITQFWGAEGKGYQALFIANLGLISIVTNIFTNSSVSYLVRKVGASKLYAQACIWTFISSVCGVIICYYMKSHSFLYLLLISSLLTGYLTFHSALYIGLQKIKYFNLLTLLQPLFLLIFMFFFYIIKQSDYFDYFYAHILSLIMVIIIAFFLTRKSVGRIMLQLDFSAVKQSFNYGFQNELSNFFHFLTLRLSFYFVLYYLGNVSLGIFSVGVAIADSIWFISKSISVVQYSKIIKEGNTQNTKKGVITTSLFSLLFTLFCVVILLLLPNTVFGYVFSWEFSEVKQIVLWMSPGILFIAFSSVYGHFFAAIGKLKIQIYKSVVGTMLVLVLSLLLIPKWGIIGACIATSLVHFVCSAIIVVYFFIFKEKKNLTSIKNVYSSYSFMVSKR
jgi:O-antigen/teichoic acid export membrane protein